MIKLHSGELDVDELRNRSDLASTLVERGDVQAAADALRPVLIDCSDDVLSDVDNQAVRFASTQLRDLVLEAKEDCLESEVATGHGQHIVPELAGLTRRCPFRDRPHILLMRVLAESGRVAEALLTYHRWREQLIEELGVEPPPQMRQLHAELLRL